MSDARQGPAASVLDWLLDPEDPPVRYQALRSLVGLPLDHREVVRARRAVLDWPPVQSILHQQNADGSWRDPEAPYQPTYTASFWTLMLLAYVGLDRSDERIVRAVEHVFRFQRPDGGFAMAGDVGANWHYEAAVKWNTARGRPAPARDAHVQDYLRQSTFSCLTGNLVAALWRLGFGEDERTRRAVDWLVEIQNVDGGWLCPYWRPHARDKHGCFMGTICALEGMSEIPGARRPHAVSAGIERGVEFLLLHRLYRADHHNWKVIDERWLTLGFPRYYRYDILRGAWVLRRLGIRDGRMTDALNVLREKRQPDGRWLLEVPPRGRLSAQLGTKGRPSKWVTWMALEALTE